MNSTLSEKRILFETDYRLQPKRAAKHYTGSKPGKRWVIYLDEIDKWLEANHKNPIPLTDEEQNAAILASHKRKPNKSSWQTDPIVEPSKKVNVAQSPAES